MRTIVDEQNSISQAPIPRYLPPQQLPTPDRGPEGASSCKGSQKVTSHSYSAFLVQGEELDFLHQGEQKTKFLSISVTYGKGIWLEPEKRKQ